MTSAWATKIEDRFFQALELMEDCRRRLSSENGVSHPCPDQAQPCLAAKMEHIRDSRAVDEDGLPNHPHGYSLLRCVWVAVSPSEKAQSLKIQNHQPAWSQAAGHCHYSCSPRPPGSSLRTPQLECSCLGWSKQSSWSSVPLWVHDGAPPHLRPAAPTLQRPFGRSLLPDRPEDQVKHSL